MEQSESFEGWAIVEVMGHKKFAGHVSEQIIAGSALVRVDVPETEHERRSDYTIVETKPGYTKLIGVGSIYCITPCSEEVARAAARELERWNDPIPVTLPKLLPAGSANPGHGAITDAVLVPHDDEYDDEYDDDE